VHEGLYLQARRGGIASHRIALTIGVAIINYVARKENELPRRAITILNAAVRLSMMLQNKYRLSNGSFVGGLIIGRSIQPLVLGSLIIADISSYMLFIFAYIQLPSRDAACAT